jgi:hypothetical protein
MALRSHVVEAAHVRYSERRRAWADTQLEARQRAGRRAVSESTVVDALLATDLCPADPATPTGCGCVA